MEESDRKTVSDVMAEIGGYLGLFVGISLVTVLEFFLFFMAIIFEMVLTFSGQKCGDGGRRGSVGSGGRRTPRTSPIGGESIEKDEKESVI